MGYSNQYPNVISLCTGIRGLERGLERAMGKLRVATYVEIEAVLIANLIAGMEAGILAPAPIWSNLKTFNAAPFCNKIHGIFGGYPCQPFSHAGKRKGIIDPRHLWPHISAIFAKVRPVWGWFENVRGHLNLGYDIVQKELNDLGYAVEPGLYSAEEVGAPHKRERLFILAIRKDCLSYFNQCVADANRHGFPGCSTQASIKNDTQRWAQCLKAFWTGGAGSPASGLPEDNATIEDLENATIARLQESGLKGFKQLLAQNIMGWGGLEQSGFLLANSSRQPFETEKGEGCGQIWESNGQSQHKLVRPGHREACSKRVGAGSKNMADSQSIEQYRTIDTRGRGDRPSDSGSKTYTTYIQKSLFDEYPDDLANSQSRQNNGGDPYTMEGSANKKESLYTTTGFSSQDVADANSLRPTDRTGSCKEESYSTEGKTYREKRDELFRQRMRVHTGKCGTVVADSTSEGLEIRTKQSTWEKLQAIKRSGDLNRWPSRPGEPQYPWEPARLESSMGYVINGYNYREDLLRAAGNGVVEQTAEVAFLDLMNKHFKIY